MSSIKKSPLNLILGTGSIGDGSIDSTAHIDTPDEVKTFLDVFVKRGYSQLDTARGYSPHAPGSCEPRLGAAGAGNHLAIDTKVSSREPGSHTKDKILAEIDRSLADLQVEQINIEYLHQPDRTTPFEEACEAMDQAHKQGKIKKWGICNYKATEVQQIIDICDARGLVKPSVYQGHYNAIVRSNEEDLFPILRKNNMSFYAYSAAAGGFFAGNYKKPAAGGRFDPKLFIGTVYTQFYAKPSIIAASDKAVQVAATHGISGHTAALRWVAHHSILNSSLGDSILLGASSVEQLEANIDTLEQGPLPEEVVVAFEAIYGDIEEDVAYHF